MPSLKLDPVSNIIDAGANAVERVAGVFTSNSEKDAQRSADEQMALLQSYQAEFHHRENRTLVDAIADAFNRLVRPVIVILVLFIFVLAYINPEHFAKITLALSSIPTGYWALLSVIIGFYFGGRMQLKGHDFRFKVAQAQAVKTLIETKKEFRKLEMDNDEPDKVVGQLANVLEVNEERSHQLNEVVDKFLKSEDIDKNKKLKELVEKLKDEPAEKTVSRRRLGPRRRR